MATAMSKRVSSIYHHKDECDLAELVERTSKFLDDVMPQIGGLCIQDFANLNELCMLITKHEKKETV